MTDDITFCMSECKNKKCFRHRSNIQDRTIPHSFSMFENTDTCPLYTKEMTNKEAIEILEWGEPDADSLPTIEFKEEYKKYREALDLAIKALEDERPQGEWLWLGDNPNTNHKWSCNKCGRGVKEQEKFCPNCGADMRKGGAEE